MRSQRIIHTTPLSMRTPIVCARVGCTVTFLPSKRGGVEKHKKFCCAACRIVDWTDRNRVVGQVTKIAMKTNKDKENSK